MSFPKGFFWGGALAANQVENHSGTDEKKRFGDGYNIKKRERDFEKLTSKGPLFARTAGQPVASQKRTSSLSAAFHFHNPRDIGSPVLRTHWKSWYPNRQAGQFPQWRLQNRIQFLPIRHHSLPDTRRLRWRFSFFAWFWTFVSAGRHRHRRFPSATASDVLRFPVGSFRTAGRAALEHDSQFFKGGAVFPRTNTPAGHADGKPLFQ